MFYHNLNPEIFSIWGVSIHYYGLMYILGILFCYWFIQRQRKAYKLTKEQVSDLVFYLVLGLITGGRLGYFLFYDLSALIRAPLQLFKVWDGGMSFHGGLAVALLFAWLYTRKQGLDFLKLADLFIVPVPVALALGRLGNFINGELYGNPTGVPWGMYFRNYLGEYEGFARHPSQLYEFFKNLAIFGSLSLLQLKKSRKPGFLLFSFMLMYGVLRTLVEFVRSADFSLTVLGVTMGQWLSFPLIAIGLIGVCKTWRK
jgi:phosphatidylglycerol---prolipoprotein diacylglyceryl transferase